MSYKSLLFCPDEATARLVTQVLSELEFTVELSFEPFVTVKKLTDEHFDALVVDCNDEQNAAVLFKGARNSSLNHSSLCVAVVEGQAGLAKAFRIGANLVLTKPINIEQSKNTLRVARGLLRKNVPPSKSAVPQDPIVDTKIAASPSSTSPDRRNISSQLPVSAPAPAPVLASTAQVPTLSSIEVEKEKTPEPEPEDAAALESLPDLTIGKFPAKSASTPAVSFLARSGGRAAAPAPALEKKNVTEIRPAAPLATHEPIFAETKIPERTEHSEPMFSSYARRSSPQRPVGSKSFLATVCLLIAGAAGFFAWQKYQPMQYLPPRAPRPDASASSTQPSNSDSKPSPVVNAPPAPSQPDASSLTNAPQTAATQPSSFNSAPNGAPEGFPTKEKIDLDDPANAPEPVITVVPKPKPLQVNTSLSPSKSKPQPDQPAPPPMILPATTASDSTLSGLVSTTAAMPKAATGTLQVSQGVTQGLLVNRVSPVYPTSALQMRRQGTVELLASISRTGAITGVKVLSGDSALAKSAVDAVRQWKYRPYLLNGEPVEIETQITVKFTLPR